MQIDTIGEMVDFGQLSEGQLFYCDLNGDRTFAMRVAFVDGVRAVPAVVSFSHEAHPALPPPMVLDISQFGNRSVLLLKNVVFRTPHDLSKWKGGTPKLDRSGSVMLGTGNCLFARAWRGSGCLDIDVVSGVAEPARNRPERLWTEDWSIVANADTQMEALLLQSAKPS